MRVHWGVAFVAGALSLVGAGQTLVGAQQQRPAAGGGAPSSQAPGRPTHATGSQSQPAPHSPGAPPAGPLATPFPNIATLSGPLPGTFRSAPRDLYRVRGPFNTGGAPYYPGYLYGAPLDESVRPGYDTPPARQPASGTLRVDAMPLSAQVFVDGLYAGTVEDLDRRHGLVLPQGPHRVELRARGYLPDAVEVAVPGGDVVIYRASLNPEAPPAPRVPPSPAAATMYVIPGCYLGNVPPRADRVAKGCDLAKVRVIAPPTASGSRATNEPVGR